MGFEPFVVFVLLRFMRKSVKGNLLHPEWDRYFKYAMIGVGVLFVLGLSAGNQPLFKWIWHLSMLGMVLIIYYREEFSSIRNIMFAILPLVVVSLFRDFSGLFGHRVFRTVDTYLDYADPFVILWLIALLIIHGRQQRALEKEKKKRIEEEQKYQITAAQKEQLEIMVAERTVELTNQKEELQHALNDLRTTQNQLIQSEKMASLGELTAGIAHEIQNPLNFVNNFAEVNMELMDELTTAFQKGNNPEVMAIAQDIKLNLSKITHHGKRADAIVKGMLQHSQNSSGQKEDTDINQLVDEYLGLSYHGLRAKDKSFNATIKKDLDPAIKNIRAIPQDIGRALLNIYNNAFYAIAEKKKLNPDNYEPTLTVRTKKLRNRVEISIMDNGNGIPEKVMDKIFQPFFTTKPAGQGTGLGLSLSYDIITKGHGGTMNVKTEKGQFTEMIIQLPA